jgi:hypothetical protein
MSSLFSEVDMETWSWILVGLAAWFAVAVGMALVLGPALKSCSRRQDAQSRNLRQQPGPTGRFRLGGSSPRPI